MSNNPIISLTNGMIADPARRRPLPMDFSLSQGEQIAIIGDNGSGKSLLVSLLTGGIRLQNGDLRYSFPSGRAAYEAISLVEFDDAYGTSDGTYYYQRRWNTTDREAVPTVAQYLSRTPCRDQAWQQELFGMLRIDQLLEKDIILLSSGELRRLHLARALSRAPEVLILESPFIGLDPPTRQDVETLLERIARRTSVILTLTPSEHLPRTVTHVYRIDRERLHPKMTAAEYLANPVSQPAEESEQVVLPPVLSPEPDYTNAIEMEGVNISYGKRTILQHLDWRVRSGEKGNVTGSNGSGKSTLLSLVCADNPQAYSQRITLFDRPRGSGESIWDIKRHIGYVSPELHRAFRINAPAADIVASGFFDTAGLFRSPNEEQLRICSQWLETFGAAELGQRSFIRLSSGEQRLILLIRAFVKDPDLLILDEPFHGLDYRRRQRALQVIEAFCRRPHKTLLFVTHYPEELPDCIEHTLHLEHH